MPTTPTWEPRRRQPSRPPEVTRARNKERSRRITESKRRAWMILADRHSDEFQMLLAAMRQQILDERGPLPGDK
jgi:hypothetical protein